MNCEYPIYFSKNQKRGQATFCGRKKTVFRGGLAAIKRPIIRGAVPF